MGGSRRRCYDEVHHHTELDRAKLMINHQPPARSGIVQQVVFPDQTTALVPQPLRVVAGCALLRLEDGSVWMLRIPGKAWSSERLRMAAASLLEVGEQDIPDSELPTRLVATLGVTNIVIEDPKFRLIDPEQWLLDESAQALAIREHNLPKFGDDQATMAHKVNMIVADLREALVSAIERFFEALDPEVRSVATRNGAFQTSTYNYLIHPEYGQYRRQFARLSPGLLPTVIHRTPGSLGEELRLIIDLGQPIVKGLATCWGVRPAVVRHLINIPATRLGNKWPTRITTLAIILNALIPNEMPKDNPAEWIRLHRILAVGQRLFRKPVWKTEAGLAWMRQAMHALHGQKSEAQWLPDAATLGRIDLFRSVLETALHRELGPIEYSAHFTDRIAKVIDDFYAGMVPHRLEQMALHFFKLREQARLEARRATRALMPLIPQALQSANGRRVIRPLTTSMDLKQHGQALGICIGTFRHFTYYAALCRHNRRFILGVFDVPGDQPCSTVHVMVKNVGKVTVIEHKGPHNMQPSLDCRNAVDELLEYCASSSWRRWQRTERQKKQVGYTLEVDCGLIRQTMGDRLYTTLVAGIEPP